MPLLTQSELSESLVEAAIAGAPAPRAVAPREIRWEALARRRSVRRFADGEIEPQTLARILGPRLPELDIAIATTAGVHRWDGTATGARIADETVAAKLRALYAPAPAIVLFIGRPLDPGTYYRSLIEAGMAGYEAWLAALDEGLAGCPFGRAAEAIAEPLRRAFGPGAYQLFTLALGRPR